MAGNKPWKSLQTESPCVLQKKSQSEIFELGSLRARRLGSFIFQAAYAHAKALRWHFKFIIAWRVSTVSHVLDKKYFKVRHLCSISYMHHSCVRPNCMCYSIAAGRGWGGQDGNPDVHSVANGLNFRFVGHAYLFPEKSNTVSKPRK